MQQAKLYALGCSALSLVITKSVYKASGVLLEYMHLLVACNTQSMLVYIVGTNCTSYTG